MSTLFILICLGLLGALLWGLIKPQSFAKLSKNRITRKALGLKLGVPTVICLLLSGATAPTQNSQVHLAIPAVAVRSTEQTTVEPIAKPILTTKEVTEQKSIPFSKVSQSSASLPKGTTKITQNGVDGTESDTYIVTYSDGIETVRTLESTKVVIPPVAEITSIGTFVASATPAPSTAPQEKKIPAGATARCKDGTYSRNILHTGTCLFHHGVAEWL